MAENGKTNLPVVPEGIDDAEKTKLIERSNELAGGIEKDGDTDELLTSLKNLGVEAQRESGQKMELLKGRVGGMLQQIDGKGGKIPNELVKLRGTLDQINPHVIGKPGWFSRLLGKTPAVGGVLRKIAVKYESVQTQIDAIVDSLREGQDMLKKDNIQLENLYKDLTAQQLEVLKNAYLGELVLAKIDERLKSNDLDETKKNKLTKIQHAVAMRVQDLRTMEQVNLQFFASLDITTDNNRLLDQSVDRTINVTTNLITVGLAIQAALSRQKQVLEATKQTQEYASNLLAANAAAMKTQTKEIGEMQNAPVLELDKVKQAYTDLIETMDELDTIKKQGIESAKKNIAELSDMSSKLKVKTDNLHASKLKDDTKPAEEAEQIENKE